MNMKKLIRIVALLSALIVVPMEFFAAESDQKIVGEDGFYCHDNEMTIVSYVDSTGCNSCKMRLSRWNNFMNGLDSSVSRGKVDLIVIANFTDGRKLEALRRRS